MSANEKNKRLIISGLLTVIIVGVHGLLSSRAVINNAGISFGWQLGGVIISCCWLGVVGYLVKHWDWGLLLVVIGGLSNLVDRWRWGFVNDYWKLPGINLVNNLNDWLIVVGMLCFLRSLWKQQR